MILHAEDILWFLHCTLKVSSCCLPTLFFAGYGLGGNHVGFVAQVDEHAYKKLLDCVKSSDINVCDKIPSGAGRPGGAKLTNPLGGAPHQVDGADRFVRKHERSRYNAG